jgi:hypothetical protein
VRRIDPVENIIINGRLYKYNLTPNAWRYIIDDIRRAVIRAQDDEKAEDMTSSSVHEQNTRKT